MLILALACKYLKWFYYSNCQYQY